MEKWLKLLDLFGLLEKLIGSISGELRGTIVKGLKEARKSAEKTPNKFDDILMFLLCALFNIPEE